MFLNVTVAVLIPPLLVSWIIAVLITTAIIIVNSFISHHLRRLWIGHISHTTASVYGEFDPERNIHREGTFHREGLMTVLSF